MQFYYSFKCCMKKIPMHVLYIDKNEVSMFIKSPCRLSNKYQKLLSKPLIIFRGYMR